MAEGTWMRDVTDCPGCHGDHRSIPFIEAEPIEGKMPLVREGRFVLWATAKCPVEGGEIMFGLPLSDGPYGFTTCKHCGVGMAINTENGLYKQLGALCSACDRITTWDEFKWVASR